MMQLECFLLAFIVTTSLVSADTLAFQAGDGMCDIVKLPNVDECYDENGDLMDLMVSDSHVPERTRCRHLKCGVYLLSECDKEGTWKGLGNALFITDDCENKGLLPRKRDKRGWRRVRIRFRFRKVWRKIRCWFSRCTPPPPPDTTPPTLTCPDDIKKTAENLQVSMKVYWPTPVARDNKDGERKVSRSGPDSGSHFYEGTTKITYHAKDLSSNWATCSFTVTIVVVRCPALPPIQDGYKKCNSGVDMLKGTNCIYGCYSGHTLEGSSSNYCHGDGKWSANQPRCIKLQCPSLLPPPANTFIQCTNDNYYRSICTYSCVPGYGILPGNTRVQVCGVKQLWKGKTPICVDTERPVFENCPSVRIAYADISSSFGKVHWEEPYAVDNSGSVEVHQIMGQPSGTLLQAGEHDIVYEANDSAGNTEICMFKAVVKQIRCHQLYPLPFTSVVCPDGRRYGSLCQFQCDDRAALQGSATVVCTKTGTQYPYGAWSFGNHQPYCKLTNKCPTLTPPKNGALPCDNFLLGKFCYTMCQKGYVFPLETQVTYPALAVCMDSGEWLPQSPIPDCIQPIRRKMRFYTKVDYYFSGPCEESLEEIKRKFLAKWSDHSAFGSVCTNDVSCTTANVVVNCGATSTSRRRRSSSIVTVTVDTQVDLSSNVGDSDIPLKMAQLNRVHTDSATALQSEGDLDLVVGETNDSIQAMGITVAPPTVDCPDGTEANDEILLCVPCSVGYFHNTTSGQCRKCPRGQYQPATQETTCIPCDVGYTTANTGATSETACIPACGPGQYSPNGAPPCSPCDVGTYSGQNGTVSCTSCPNSRITLQDGTISASDCSEFDIRFPEDKEGDVLVSLQNAPIDVTADLYISMWFSCVQCAGSRLLTMSDSNTELLLLDTTDKLTVTFNGAVAEVDYAVTDSLWHNVQLHLNKEACTVSVDGTTVTTDSIVALPSSGLQQNVNITLGDNNFIGRISQVHISNTTSEAFVTLANTCFTGFQGNQLAWRDFVEADIDVAVLAKSACDDFNACDENPCVHGGCTDTLSGYTCSCEVGYTGINCEKNIDDCIDHACDNSAQCVDGVDSYTCLCGHGFTGLFCEIQLVHGGWGKWEEVSVCSVTCGAGFRSRKRACDNPEPKNGGDYCPGDDTQTETCNMEECPVYECHQDPVIPNGDSNCTIDETGTRKTCQPSCNEGFDFGGPLSENIECSNDTNHQWTTSENELPTCTKVMKSEKTSVHYSGQYTNVYCNTNSHVRSKVEETVAAAVASLDCMANGTCDHKATDFTDCTGARVRRETQQYGFTVQISCSTAQVDMDACLQTLSSFIDIFEEAAAAAQFDIYVSNILYTLDSNATTFIGVTECPVGSIPISFYCVPCGLGVYQVQEDCDTCPIGTYQDEQGQISCKQCPQGWTTQGTGSKSASNCNIFTPVYVKDTSWVAILVTPLALGAGVGSVMLIVYCVWKRHFRKVHPRHHHTDMAMNHLPPDYVRNRVFVPRHQQATEISSPKKEIPTELCASPLPVKQIPTGMVMVDA